MGWVVGFEPTYTGATTLGLNHLTIPTMSMLVNFVHCVVAVSLVLGYVHKYVPFGTRSTRLALRKIPCAYLDFKLCITALLRTISCAYKFVNFVHCVVAVSLVMRVQFLKELATWNGLEPSTSSVTGWHSNQLNYQAANGGSYRARTYDPLLVRQMLSQLS